MTRLFMFCGLIACIGQPVSASCPIQLSPPSVVVRYGDPVSINCSTSVAKPEGMGWESPYGGTGLISGARFVPWEVPSLQAWIIAPTCFINLPDEEVQCLKKASIIVYKMPDSVSVSQPMQPGVLEGLSYSMQCNIVDVAPINNLSVIWYKGNEIIHTESFDRQSKTPGNLSSVISLIAHREDDGIRISCAANLNLGPLGPDQPMNSSESHAVVVFYPPTFIEPETETVDISSDDEIVLNCTAVAKPMPEYSWQSPDPPLQTMENEAVVTSSLLFPGTYTCTASNTYGSKTKQFIITQKPGNRTTFAAIVGVSVAVGVLLLIGGVVFGTPEGTFSFSKGSYIRGTPASSAPV